MSEAAERSCVFVSEGMMLRNQVQFHLFLFSVPGFGVTRGTQAADGTVRQIVLSHVAECCLVSTRPVMCAASKDRDYRCF